MPVFDEMADKLIRRIADSYWNGFFTLHKIKRGFVLEISGRSIQKYLHFVLILV